MYAGTTIGNQSGALLGAHQRIDRIARKHLSRLLKSEDLFRPKSKSYTSKVTMDQMALSVKALRRTSRGILLIRSTCMIVH